MTQTRAYHLAGGYPRDKHFTLLLSIGMSFQSHGILLSLNDSSISRHAELNKFLLVPKFFAGKTASTVALHASLIVC